MAADDRPATGIDPEIARYIEREVARRVDERVAGLERSLAAVNDQLGALAKRVPSERVTILVFSGEFDALLTAFIVGTGAVAMGMEVTMYFTFWGLVGLKKDTTFRGKTIEEKMIAMLLPPGPKRLPSSRLNMLGIGPLFFKRVMAQNNVETLGDMMDLAREMGIKMVACQMSMGVMGIKQEELVDGLTYGGVATYLEDATDSKVTLFI